MPTTTFKINKGEVGFSLTDPAVPIADAEIGDYSAFSCVVTSGMIAATANMETEDVPGTFCDPPSETVTPAAATFVLQLTVLQDPQDSTTAGLAKFLWDNDSGVTGDPVWFYLGLAEGAAPKAIGQCYITPMDFGGEARTVLTAELEFPIEGRPDLEFGAAVDALAEFADEPAADEPAADEPAETGTAAWSG